MADEFDGCEYIWNHQFTMQRLLNLIRQNQNVCSDTECMDVSGRMLQQATVPTTGNEDTNFTMMTMLMIFAVIMYFIRPQSIMNFTNPKRRSQGQDPNGSSPPPPPPAPPAVH